jgi:predicted MPP superfamily phosphohydrolase
LKGLAAFSTGTLATGGYALAEPWRLGITRYQVTPAGWPEGLKLKLAVIADLHVCEPWMSIERVRQIVARTNAAAPDAVLLLGDYVVGARMLKFARDVEPQAWADVLATLQAPLGIHAVLGNHDWWDPEVQRRRSGPTPAGVALQRAGIGVYENQAMRLTKQNRPFWIAGLGDQWAFFAHRKIPRRWSWYDGVHDLPATMALVTDDAPVVLMAHEPDIFPEVSSRVALTVSGHTHGGQVRMAGYSPIIPSKYGRRFAYGHIVEGGRNLIVSGGLGCSGVPVRFGVPPEIVLVELGRATPLSV